MNANTGAISAQANLPRKLSRLARRAGGRSQNRLHTQMALLEYLLLGKVEW
jgi:hypothetical protein